MSMRGRHLRVRVLGSCRLEVEGRPVAIAPAQRRLLARLAASPGDVVERDELYEALWGRRVPATARAAVHNQVSRLRAQAGPELLETVGDGYRLRAATDLDDLREAVRDAERSLTSDPARTLALAERALGLCDGVPFAELELAELQVRLRREVDELLAAALDLEVSAALALGLGARALAPARRAVADEPHDEGRSARLARVLALVGRRGDALAEIARVRRALRTDLGLDGSEELERLEVSIRGDADPPSEGLRSRPEVEQVLDGVERGTSVLVVAGTAEEAGPVLAGARDRLLERGGVEVAMVRVRGYRDVAVAALLDLLDLLGVEPVPALGPVGSFVPAIARLAERRPVALIVERFDAAGPSTRRALLEASRLDRVALVAGARSERPGEFGLVVAVGPAPATPADDLRRRFAALPPAPRATLTAVAIADDGVPTAVLEDLGVGDGIADALEHAMLVPTTGEGVAFADPAMRELVEADTPAGVRAELHHALGTALATRDDHEQAARHLLAAASIEPPAAIAAARAAAADATAAGAHLDAAAWLEQAIECCTDDRERIALRIALGDALRLAGVPTHVDVLTAAADEAASRRDDELLGDAVFALLALGGTTVSTAADPDVDALLDRAVARIEDEQRVALVKAAGSLACSMTGRAERSRRLFLEAEAAASRPAVRMRVLPFAYMAVGLPGDLRMRRRHAEELLRLAATHDDPVAAYEGLHLAFSVHLQEGDGDELRRVHHEMTALVDRVGDVGRRWALHYSAAALAHLEGALDEAERLGQAAFTQFASVSASRATAVLFGQLLGIRLAQGRVAELRPALERLVADQPGVPAWNAALAMGLAEVDPPRAIAVARRARASAEGDFSWLAGQLVGGRAVALAVRAGAPDGGVLSAYRAALEPWSGRISWQGTCSYGPVDTTLALIADASGEGDRAHRLAAEAREQAERLRAPCFVDDLGALGLG